MQQNSKEEDQTMKGNGQLDTAESCMTFTLHFLPLCAFRLELMELTRQQAGTQIHAMSQAVHADKVKDNCALNIADKIATQFT